MSLHPELYPVSTEFPCVCFALSKPLMLWNRCLCEIQRPYLCITVLHVFTVNSNSFDEDQDSSIRFADISGTPFRHLLTHQYLKFYLLTKKMLYSIWQNNRVFVGKPPADCLENDDQHIIWQGALKKLCGHLAA